MKQKLFTFLLLSAAIFSSCKKDNFPNIREYDDEQIQNYIKANGLTGMVRDTTDGDTSGIYYQILEQGNTTKPRIEYSDNLSMVYTIRSFDGKYSATDTINNHFRGYLGHFNQAGLPLGVQQSVFGALKYKGTAMRVLIPSRMAYGKSGYGTGSSSNTNSRIAGNQCLDYFIRIVDNQNVYDDLSIKSYMSRNSLNIAEYTKSDSLGVYYKVTGPDTSETFVSGTTTVGLTYTGKYLNDVVFDQTASGSTSSFQVDGTTAGFALALKKAKPGQTLSVFIPSRGAYGLDSYSSGTITIPAFSILHFDVQMVSATN